MLDAGNISHIVARLKGVQEILTALLKLIPKIKDALDPPKTLNFPSPRSKKEYNPYYTSDMVSKAQEGMNYLEPIQIQNTGIQQTIRFLEHPHRDHRRQNQHDLRITAIDAQQLSQRLQDAEALLTDLESFLRSVQQSLTPRQCTVFKISVARRNRSQDCIEIMEQIKDTVRALKGTQTLIFDKEYRYHISDIVTTNMGWLNFHLATIDHAEKPDRTIDGPSFLYLRNQEADHLLGIFKEITAKITAVQDAAMNAFAWDSYPGPCQNHLLSEHLHRAHDDAVRAQEILEEIEKVVIENRWVPEDPLEIIFFAIWILDRRNAFPKIESIKYLLAQALSILALPKRSGFAEAAPDSILQEELQILNTSAIEACQAIAHLDGIFSRHTNLPSFESRKTKSYSIGIYRAKEKASGERIPTPSSRPWGTARLLPRTPAAELLPITLDNCDHLAPRSTEQPNPAPWRLINPCRTPTDASWPTDEIRQ